MKPVAASLAPLATCPGFFLWHALGALMCIPAFLHAIHSADPGAGGHVAVLVLPTWSAYVMTSLQRDLLRAESSFGLPGHRDALRRALFLVGTVASLAAGLTALAYPGLQGVGVYASAWSLFCFSMVTYLVVAGSVFALDHVAASLGLVTIPVAILLESVKARTVVQEAALFSPFVNGVVLVALSVFVWRWLGSAALARRLCGQPFLSLQRFWSRSASEEHARSRRLTAMSKPISGLRRLVLQTLFDRIGRRPALSLRRHLAAAQYEVAGHLLPVRPWTVPFVLVSALAILIAAGYVPPRDDRPDTPTVNIVYVASCVLAMHFWVPVQTTMLMPADRRHRFWISLALAGCYGLLVLASSLLLFAVLQGMGRLAPPLSWGEKVYDFWPADLGPALVPLVYLPLTMILKTVCGRWLVIPEIVLLIVAASVIVRGGVALRDLSPVAAITLLALSWTLLVGVLFLYGLRRDLVRV